MGDLDTPAGMEAQEILDKTAKWTEKIYDMDKEQYDQYIASHGMDCNKILYIEYSYIQIGKTDEWLQDISAEIGDPLTVRREILLQRLHGSSNLHLLRKILNISFKWNKSQSMNYGY